MYMYRETERERERETEREIGACRVWGFGSLQTGYRASIGVLGFGFRVFGA